MFSAIGYSEHSSAYYRVVNRVLTLGGAVISHDHYAHGRSGPHQADSIHRCQIYRYLPPYTRFNFYFEANITSVGGVMVSIDAFQALDPGSIPGHRTFFLFKLSFHTTPRIFQPICKSGFRIKQNITSTSLEIINF